MLHFFLIVFVAYLQYQSVNYANYGREKMLLTDMFSGHLQQPCHNLMAAEQYDIKWKPHF